VLLGDELEKMAQREIRIDVAFEPAQKLDGARLYPLAARSPAALVHHRVQSVVLHPPANPAHLARLDPDDLSRLHPAHLPGNGLGDHFPPRHRSRLTPHPPLDLLHRAALLQPAVIFKCL
jgi:hypothetical protein